MAVSTGAITVTFYHDFMQCIYYIVFTFEFILLILYYLIDTLAYKMTGEKQLLSQIDRL